MTNKYQSIVDDTAGVFLLSLADAPIHKGHWCIVDGQLALQQADGKHLLFDFERGDELSDMLIDFLNHLPYLAAAARGQKQ